MRKFSLMLLILLVLVGCGDEFTEDEERALKDLVKDEVVPEKEIVWEKDGKEMALILAGSFEMGDHFGEGQAGELPVHTVTLDGFYMDKTEVTVGQFMGFVEQSGYEYAGEWQEVWQEVAALSPEDDYPMVWVNWIDATAYAKWAGKRLPTEAEWEYAARGGLIGKRYVWGNEITHDHANWGDTVNGKDKWRYCSPVGSFEANGYGLFDTGGNVWEWCADRYDEDYYQNSPATNPPGPGTGSRRVLRGGSWLGNTSGLRVASRLNYPPSGFWGRDFGFRCVSDVPSPEPKKD